VSDVNEEQDLQGNSSKSNSVNSEHSLQSHGISASSQGSSTNSLPVHGMLAGGGMDPNVMHHAAAAASHAHAQAQAAAAAAAAAAASSHTMGGGDYQNPVGFHRPQAAQMQAQSKLSQVRCCLLLPVVEITHLCFRVSLGLRLSAGSGDRVVGGT
jgi:hypothetical protein